MNNSLEDNNRIVKLLDEYSQKLKELLDIYQNDKKRRFNFYVYTFIIVVASIAIATIYYSYKGSVENATRMVFMILMISLIITLIYLIGYYFINFINAGRGKMDLIDEIVLVTKQLKYLISIGSQTNEHILPNDSALIKLELNLKLTQAENLILRASRLPSIKYYINDFDNSYLEDTFINRSNK